MCGLGPEQLHTTSHGTFVCISKKKLHDNFLKKKHLHVTVKKIYMLHFLSQFFFTHYRSFNLNSM
jgi:hypothetical protein